jgi:hypothetical protein
VRFRERVGLVFACLRDGLKSAHCSVRQLKDRSGILCWQTFKQNFRPWPELYSTMIGKTRSYYLETPGRFVDLNATTESTTACLIDVFLV